MAVPNGLNPRSKSKPKPRLRFPDCPTPFSDHVFKVAHGVEVPLRIWPATSGEGPRPWMIWFHGGGFTFGKHYHPNPWVLPAFRSRGYHVVSAAYRFVPHVSLWEVIDDSQDAFAWCRVHISDAIAKLGGAPVDLDRYVVAGDSMGGLLVTLAGHNFSPRPLALACMYPFTHPEDEYFHPAEDHPFRKVLRVGEPGSDVISDEVEKARISLGGAAGDTLAPMHPDVLAFVNKLNAKFHRVQEQPDDKNTPTLSALPISWTYTPLQLYTFLSSRDPKAASFAAAFRHEQPPALSLEGLRAYWGMPNDWTPKHPILQGDAMVFEYAARQMIRIGGRRELYGSDEEWSNVLHKISAVEITKERARLLPQGQALVYPPTFFIHGTADTTVPCYHSEKLAKELKAAGVPVQERYAVGEQHNFDLDIFGPSHPKWKQFIEPCMDFVDSYVWHDQPCPAAAASRPRPRGAPRSEFLVAALSSKL